MNSDGFLSFYSGVKTDGKILIQMICVRSKCLPTLIKKINEIYFGVYTECFYHHVFFKYYYFFLKKTVLFN